MKNTHLSFSALKAFAKSPNHFIQYKTEKPDSAAMAFGRAFHILILEPDTFNERVVVSPECDRRTKEGKATYAEFLEMAANKEVISPAEWYTMQKMRTAILAHPVARDFVANNQKEVSASALIHGVEFKGIADILGTNFAVDLKTAQTADPDEFIRTAHNAEYHLQAAIYRHLFGITNFYWIVAEKDKPHNVSVFLQDEDAAGRAEYRLRNLITLWNEWDGNPAPYTNEVVTLSLPKWA